MGNTPFISRRRVAPSLDPEKSITKLMRLSAKGDVAGVKELLSHGSSSLDDQDSHGYTALFYGVQSHNPGMCSPSLSSIAVVEELLRSGANYRHQAIRGVTAVMMAVTDGTEAVLECLCAFVSQQPSAESHAQAALDMQDTEGMTALMVACKLGSASSVSQLLRFGASASLRSFRGESALTFALMYARASCVEALVSSCGFLDARSRTQPHGALLAAAELGESAVVRCLARQPAYLQQFLGEIALSPSRAAETALEVALREESKRGLREKAALAALCLQQARSCLRRLVGVLRGDKAGREVSLAGLAECAKWCVKMSKVLAEDVPLAPLEPFWDVVERVTERQHAEWQAARRDCRGAQLAPSASSRLLLSLIEIYVLAHYSLKHELGSAAERLHPRLVKYYSLHFPFLTWDCREAMMGRCLVACDPSVFDMLHFFKHTFTLFKADHSL